MIHCKDTGQPEYDVCGAKKILPPPPHHTVPDMAETQPVIGLHRYITSSLARVRRNTARRHGRCDCGISAIYLRGLAGRHSGYNTSMAGFRVECFG